MKTLNISFLIGNGFNYFVSDYYNNYKEQVIEKMKKYLKKNPEKAEDVYTDICHMLGEYKTLLNFLSIDAYNNKGEELIEKLDALFSQLDESLMESFIDSVKNKVKEKMEESLGPTGINIEDRSVRKLIARTMYYKDSKSSFIFELEQRLLSDDKKINLNAITTNYDGISEKVFDPFVNGYQTIYNALALHGTYTSKQIICHNPNKKLDAINSDEQLKNGFEEFEKIINDTEILIIFGNSLASDKHILNVLNSKIYEKVIIVDKEPYSYISSYAHQPFIYNAISIKVIPTCKHNEILDESYFFADTPEKLIDGLERCLQN